MSKITIRLDGAAARHIVYTVAFTYALLSIKSRLCHPHGTVNAPWFGVANRNKGITVHKAYLQWIAGIDADVICYRSAMASIISPVPPAPVVEWKPWKEPGTGKVYPCRYSATKAADAAREYAATIVRKTIGETK